MGIRTAMETGLVGILLTYPNISKLPISLDKEIVRPATENEGCYGTFGMGMILATGLYCSCLMYSYFKRQNNNTY